MAEKIDEDQESKDPTTRQTSEKGEKKANDPAASPAVIHDPVANKDAPRQSSG
jgi:hypothetical protein